MDQDETLEIPGMGPIAIADLIELYLTPAVVAVVERDEQALFDLYPKLTSNYSVISEREQCAPKTLPSDLK